MTEVRANSTYGEGRRCVVCGAKLSIYNETGKCFTHHLPPDSKPRPEHHSICTSYPNVGQAEAYYNEIGTRYIPGH